VTEMISSVDLIEEQIRVAMGEKLRYKQVLRMTLTVMDCDVNSVFTFIAL